MQFPSNRRPLARQAEDRFFKLLGRWTSGTGTPAWALAVQGAITYKPWMDAGAGIILLAGLGVYRLDQRKPGAFDNRTLSETDTPTKHTS